MSVEIEFRMIGDEPRGRTPRKNLNAERKGQCRISTFPQARLPLVLLNCEAEMADILWDQRLRKKGLLKEGPPWNEFFQTINDNKSTGQLRNTLFFFIYFTTSGLIAL